MIDLKTFLFGGLATAILGWLFLLAAFHYPLITVYSLMTLFFFGMGGMVVLNWTIQMPLVAEDKEETDDVL